MNRYDIEQWSAKFTHYIRETGVSRRELGEQRLGPRERPALATRRQVRDLVRAIEASHVTDIQAA